MGHEPRMMGPEALAVVPYVACGFLLPAVVVLASGGCGMDGSNGHGQGHVRVGVRRQPMLMAGMDGMA